MKNLTKKLRVTVCVLLLLFAGWIIGEATRLPTVQCLLYVYAAGCYAALAVLIILWTKPFKP